MKKIIFLFYILLQLKNYSQTTTIVPTGSNWKYLDNVATKVLHGMAQVLTMPAGQAVMLN